MVRQWSLPNYFASKTQKFRCVIIFLSGMQMRQISRRMEMIHPTIGWRRYEHGTHKHAHGSWILWFVSRVRLKTMHSLSFITSWLPYITLCYTDSRYFSAPGTIARGSFRLPPRSLASSRWYSLVKRKNIHTTDVTPLRMIRKKKRQLCLYLPNTAFYGQHFFTEA